MAYVRHGVFPDRQQELVLRAALLEGAEAIAAYRTWRGTVDLSGNFDRTVFRLLPLLYSNLTALGVEDDLTSRLKGSFRLAWVANQRVFERTRPILEALLQAGFPVMALKGAPLALRYYEAVATRPMSDVDLLIPEQNANAAQRVLANLGLKPYFALDEDTLRFRHANLFTGPDQFQFDLHWNVVPEFCGSSAEAAFWTTAEAFTFLDREILMPDPTRMLLHTLLHGVYWNAETPVRWVADAMCIFRRRSADIDWSWLTAFTERHRLSSRTWLGLSYLREHFAAPVPRETIERLAQMRLSLLERMEHSAYLRNDVDVYDSALGPLVDVAVPFSRYVTMKRPAWPVRDFFRYLRFRWELNGRRQIPLYLARGAYKRFIRRGMFRRGLQSVS